MSNPPELHADRVWGVWHDGAWHYTPYNTGGPEPAQPYIHVDVAAPEALVERVNQYRYSADTNSELYKILFDVWEHFTALREPKA